jgi:hypothetical protein
VDGLLVETLLRKILLRLSGQRLASAWLVVFAFALCGSLGHPVGHEDYASTTRELQQPAEKHAVASQHRRLTVVEAPAEKVAKHGPAGESGAAIPPRQISLTSGGPGILAALAAVAFVPKRRVSSAVPRAPPC